MSGFRSPKGYDTFDELTRLLVALLNRWPWRKRPPSDDPTATCRDLAKDAVKWTGRLPRLGRPNNRERPDGSGAVICPNGHDKHEAFISRYDMFKPIYCCDTCGTEWQYELTTRVVVLTGPGVQA